MTINDAFDAYALQVRITEAHGNALSKLEEGIQERVSDTFYDILEAMQVTFPGESEEEQEEKADDFVQMMMSKFFSNMVHKGE